MYINYPISFISMNDTDKDVTLLHNKLIPKHTHTHMHPSCIYTKCTFGQ